MKSLRTAALLSFLACAALQAQRFEISPFASYVKLNRGGLGSISTSEAFDGNDTKLAPHGPFYGIRVTWNTKGYWGQEFGYMQGKARMTSVFRQTIEGTQTTRELRDRVGINAGFYNFMMYMMPAGEWWRPYITVGAQTFKYGAPNFPEWEGGGWRNVGVNFGGGLKLKAKNLIFRMDFRDHLQGKPYGLQFPEFTSGGGLIHQLEGSVGIGIGF